MNKIKQLFQFFQNSWLELRRVTWPNQQEILQSTLGVFAMVLIAGILLWSVDLLSFWTMSKLANI